MSAVRGSTSIFVQRNFFDACLMTTAVESRVEEKFDNFDSCFLFDETSRQATYIGIVVLTGQFGNIRIPTQSAANSLMFVYRHANAFAATTNGNTAA